MSRGNSKKVNEKNPLNFERVLYYVSFWSGYRESSATLRADERLPCGARTLPSQNLPLSNGNRINLEEINALFDRETNKMDFFCLLDEFYFDVVRTSHGKHELAFRI